MDFNLDDPLAGILSDGSDDSFFDDDIIGKKKPAKKKETIPISQKKNELFDLGGGDPKSKPTSVSSERKNSLFGLGEADSKKVLKTDDVKPVDKKSDIPSPAPRTPAAQDFDILLADSRKDVGKSEVGKSSTRLTTSSSFVDKLDILDEEVPKKKEPMKPLVKGKSSHSLLDDILGVSVKTGGSSQTRPTTAAKAPDFEFDSLLGKSESKQTFLSTKPPPKQNVKPENPREVAPQAKKEAPPKKKSSEDWLGVFQDQTTDNNDEDDDTGMPSWLVGGDAKKKKQPEDRKTPVPPKADTPQPENSAPAERHLPPQLPDPNFEMLAKGVAGSKVLQGSNDDDVNAEALYLQQQESQLMVALQLKAQEEKLAAMQIRQEETTRVQRESVRAHQEQVDGMLRRQAANRLQMQAVIAAHQDRITQRIKSLLGPPQGDNYPEIDGEENYEAPVERKESSHTKEKKQLLQLVQSLQENHDKEIDLMETSYRRQLAFLEVALNQYEERMKEESEKLEKFYEEKISWLEAHHQLHKKLTEENMVSMSERHKAENEMLRQQHLENVRILQEHHSDLMTNVKNALKQEQTLISDSKGFSSNLIDLVADVKESKTQCQMLVEKVQAIAENSQRDTVMGLQARETQINEMMQHLKKERENFETEKYESRDMIKLLESRLKQMTSMIEDDSANLKQKRMEFEFEKATFGKQTEFAKNVLKKQDEEMKMLKDDIKKEYQTKIARIDEEKTKAQKDAATAAKEKSSIQSLRMDLEKMKNELQSQLEEVTEERSRMNIEKQQMHMEEQRILAKSRDLDLLAKTAIEKQSQADKKYSEAEFIQRKYEERIRRMQEHVVSLNAREKQIAKEKVALSRERLSIHNERKQIEGRQQCSLCKTSQNVPYANYDNTYALPDSFLHVPVSRDYGAGNATNVMSALESDMAHLLGRNFGLRNSMEGEIHAHDKEDHDNFESIRRETQSPSKDSYMDPKFMMLRLDVQQVLSNLEQNKKEEDNDGPNIEENYVD